MTTEKGVLTTHSADKENTIIHINFGNFKEMEQFF